jgi:hypothetical protein
MIFNLSSGISSPNKLPRIASGASLMAEIFDTIKKALWQRRYCFWKIQPYQMLVLVLLPLKETLCYGLNYSISL